MNKRKKWLSMLLTALIFTVCSGIGAAYGEEADGEAGDKTLAPYFFIESTDPTVDMLPLKETNVSTNINGVIAETFVTQTYTNEGQNPINASYCFPASTKVAVHGMKMQIGDKVVTAKIKEKEEAKEEFEQAKNEGKSASLLEQQRPNVFTMDVANIMPGDTVLIELHYSELIVSTEGTYQFLFPTVVGPRYPSASEDDSEETNQWVESPYRKSSDTPSEKYNITLNISSAVPIGDMTSKSHQIDVNRENETTAKITLTNPEAFAGDRDFILDYKLTGEEMQSGLMLGTGEDENFFMMMVQPPERIKSEDIPPREYIFVLDVSGSMEGYPISTAKNLIRNLVTNLKETDRFNLVLFSGSSAKMSEESVFATLDNIDRATTLIDSQSGGGGTELAPALLEALAIPSDPNFSRSVIIITDGYLSGEAEIFDLVSKNLGTTNFFPFGIGSSVNHYLIEGIAKAGLGESFTVTDAADAAEMAERFRTYIQSPILTNVQVVFDGFDVYDVEPSNSPTLFAQKPIVMYGKWRDKPQGTIRISGKRGGEDYAQDIKVSETPVLESNNSVRYLWARKKVEVLTDYGIGGEDFETVKKQVTDLGLKYSMITPYTSFVAVLETVRNTDKNSTDVKQPLPMPSGVSDMAIGTGYAIGSEPGNMILMFGLLLVIGKGILIIKKKKNLKL